MTGRTHIVGGIAFLWIVLPLVSFATTETERHIAVGALVLGAFLGSLLPDLDKTTATLAHFTLRLHQTRWEPFALPSLLINRSLGHRGVLHSLAGIGLLLLVLGTPLLAFGGNAALWFLAGISMGAFSHLLLDACTVSGVPLFWPDRWNWHLVPRSFRMMTGSPEEEIVFVTLAGFALLLLALVAFHPLP